jgi:BirA family biotin operon repressor/biotin-[acetyl-CoA-carboxylase] ligase
VDRQDHRRVGPDDRATSFEPPEDWRSLALTDPAVAAAGGWTVWHVAETGSTNADLLRAAADAPDRTVLVAGHQRQGRGRLDRRWDAPPGANLLVSMLFCDPPEPVGESTRRVGLAVIDAVRACTGGEARLKWPNDVLLDGVKLAGILAQRSPEGPVVVGLGLNVGWAPDGAGRLGDGIDPVAVLTEVLRAFDNLLDDVHEAYRAALDTLGRRVRVELPDAELVGTAVDVESDGRLVVVDECAISHRIDVGDVVHLRASSGA